LEHSSVTAIKDYKRTDARPRNSPLSERHQQQQQQQLFVSGAEDPPLHSGVLVADFTRRRRDSLVPSTCLELRQRGT